MVGVEVTIAPGPDEFTGRKVADLRDHERQQRVAGYVERNSEENIGRALVKLAAEFAVGHIELKQCVTGGEVMVIGGEDLYRQMLASADRLYLTRVELDPEGDAWFPEFEESAWRLTEERAVPAGDGYPAHRYQVFDRG